MLNYIPSNKGIRKGQISTIVIFAFLIILNSLIYAIDRSMGSLLVVLVTLLLALLFTYFGSKLYEINFIKGEIVIGNFFHKEKKFSISEFKEFSVFVSLAGIYKLTLNNGDSFLFTIDSSTQAKNLFNIDSNKLAQHMTKKVSSFPQGVSKENPD